MKNLVAGAAVLVCIQMAFSQTNVNGRRVQIGDWDGALAPTFRPTMGNGAPASANCNTAASITSSTNASPIVVTKTSHGLTNGTVITVYGHATNTAANGTWMAGAATTNTFALCGYWDGTTCQNPAVGNGVGGATGFFSTQVGRIYFRNDATAGQNLYFCTDSTGSPAWTQHNPTTSGAPATNQVALFSSSTAITGTASDSTTTHALFATAGAPSFRAVAAGDIPSGLRTHGFGAAFSAPANTNVAYGVIPFGCTISATNIMSDATALTFKVWKRATSATGLLPTAANVINTSGISWATGSPTRSTTVSDFTNTTPGANDEFAIVLSGVTGTPTFATIFVECDQ